MKGAPSLHYDTGSFKISWHTPKYLGGPISRFQVMVKQSGKEVNETHVNYLEGEIIRLLCIACTGFYNVGEARLFGI